MQPEKIPSWVERILLPGLNEVKGEIKELRVEEKVDFALEPLNFRFKK